MVASEHSVSSALCVLSQRFVERDRRDGCLTSVASIRLLANHGCDGWKPPHILALPLLSMRIPLGVILAIFGVEGTRCHETLDLGRDTVFDTLDLGRGRGCDSRQQAEAIRAHPAFRALDTLSKFLNRGALMVVSSL